MITRFRETAIDPGVDIASVGYTLVDTTRTVVLPRTQSGLVLEGSGLASAVVAFPNRFVGQIRWDNNGVVFAVEDVDLSSVQPDHAAGAAPLPAAPSLPDTYGLTVQGIRAKLVGLDAWLEAAERQAVPYDSARIRKNIPAMVRRFERDTTVQVRACQVITRDDGTYTVRDPITGKIVGANGLPVKKEEAYTYYPDSARDYFLTTLKTRPVQSVQRVRILFGQQQVLEIPRQWYEVDGQSGSFQILPVAGGLMYGAAGASFALLQAGFGNRAFIPHVVHFDYTAGLPVGWHDDDEYADLLRALESACALSVLEDIAHLADAGLSGKSISGGGSGESYQYTRFADRKAELKAAVDDYARLWKEQSSPLMMAGL